MSKFVVAGEIWKITNKISQCRQHAFKIVAKQINDLYPLDKSNRLDPIRDIYACLLIILRKA